MQSNWSKMSGELRTVKPLPLYMQELVLHEHSLWPVSIVSQVQHSFCGCPWSRRRGQLALNVNHTGSCCEATECWKLSGSSNCSQCPALALAVWNSSTFSAVPECLICSWLLLHCMLYLFISFNGILDVDRGRSDIVKRIKLWFLAFEFQVISSSAGARWRRGRAFHLLKWSWYIL